ncbi:hypothetical protein JG688_00014872 [Phytophthora aleatoria]|uniref:Uncharacterized protein n=1 Tax=Phytophthora aleatoria TaxID=2496075 RepID=A0A8J5MD87_9STRA|nr:hypothetical protein JG688_00014872 [Phytophthora aleatoria]
MSFSSNIDNHLERRSESVSVYSGDFMRDSVDIDIDEESDFAAGSDFGSGRDDDEDEDIEHGVEKQVCEDSNLSIETNEVMNYEFDFPDYNLDVASSCHGPSPRHGDVDLDFELVSDTLLDLVCQHQLDEEAKEMSETQTFRENSLGGNDESLGTPRK